MKRTPFDDLWLRFAAGETLDEDEQRSLATALADNEEWRRAYLADRHLDGLLRALARARMRDGTDTFVKEVSDRLAAAKDAEGFVARVERQLQSESQRLVDERRPRRRVLVFVSIGAVAAIAAALALWPRHPNSFDPRERPAAERVAESSTNSAAESNRRSRAIATLAEVEGTTFIVDSGGRSSARAGQAVRSGQAVLTERSQSAALLRYQDGSTLHLGGNTHVALGDALEPDRGHRASLLAGTVRVAITKQQTGSSFVLVTPHALAEVLGTQFVLTVTSTETLLRVDHGRVRLQGNAGDTVVVLAGQQATARKGMALALQTRRARVLFLVRSSVVLEPGDAAIERRLDGLGVDVLVRNALDDVQGDLQDSALLLISSTLESLDVNTRFRDLPIPVITWESGLFDDMGMTGALKQSGRNGGQAAAIDEHSGKLVIIDPSHPLAAGLSGTVRVTSGPGIRLRWATPGPAAAVVAIYPGRPSRAAVFGYERGATMVGTIAPARRVGLFLGEETAPTLTPAGWALFDAAVAWCLRPR